VKIVIQMHSKQMKVDQEVLGVNSIIEIM